MLLTHGKWLAGSCAIVLGFITFSVIYAYRVSAKRTADDPEKKVFSPYAILLAPITLPFLLIINLLFLFLSTIMFGILLVFFPFALLLFRKPFLIQWILKQALKIGNELLEIDTVLLRATGLYRPSTVFR